MKSRLKSSTSCPLALLKLAEHVGSFIEYWGFKKIHGKIWTLAFLSKEPVNAQLFIDTLGVSKGLVSLALKDLLFYRVLIQTNSASKKHQSYVCNPDIMNVIFDVLRDRELYMLGEIKLAQEQCRDIPNDKLKAMNFSSERIQDIGKMISEAEKVLRLFIQLKKIDFNDLAAALSLSVLLNSK